MIKLLIPILCLAFVFGQERVPKKNMKVMMKWQLTEYLDLGETQAEKFFPKMNAHEKMIKELNAKIKTLRDDLEMSIASGNSSKKNNRTNIEKIKKLEQQKIELKSTYLLSLEDVLEPSQVSKLMIFEKRFKRTLKDQLRKHPNARDIRSREKEKTYPKGR